MPGLVVRRLMTPKAVEESVTVQDRMRQDGRLMDHTEVSHNMTDALGSGQAEEGTGSKENFIGKVLFSRVECDCEICSAGREAGGDEYESDVDHMAHVEPLTEYDNNQNILGLNVSKSYGSKWMVFVGHVENIHGPLADNGIESLDDITEFLEGRVYEWRDITFEEDEEFTWEHAPNGGYSAVIKDLFSGMTNPPKNLMVPVREVTNDDELADLGAEDTSEVEEVDF